MATRFSSLERDVSYGLRKFPAASQYHSSIGHLISSADPRMANRVYALAQRDWHVRGQTGCMFARLAARSASTLRWDYVVVSDLRATPEACNQIIDALDCAVADRGCQVLSFLFPTVVEPLEAVEVVYFLASRGPFWLEANHISEDSLHLHLRYPVGASGVQAWIMGFAPFPFLPNTRRSPYFELAVRVKPKPTTIFHRLNQDRGLAHLADAQIKMDPKHQEHRWQSTLRRTRMILGSEPDEISAAKSTLVVPLDLVQGLHSPHDLHTSAQRSN